MDKQTWRDIVLPLLPERIRQALYNVNDEKPLLEIRLRLGYPIQLVYAEHDRLLYAPNGKGMMTAEDCKELLLRICEQSVYAWSEELKNGFVTLQGGYRVGICGRAVMQDGKIERFSEVNAFNFRIVRAIKGVGEPLLPSIKDEDDRLLSTLIVSPPNGGKTTLLRDIVRLVSWGVGIKPQRIALVDERFEIAGCVRGQPQFDIGPRTDVMSGMTKARAMSLMLATMSPQVIATDELQQAGDIDAALQAQSGGVTLVATAHGGGVEDVLKRGQMKRLYREQVFSRYVQLYGTGVVKGITDERGREVEICIRR